MLKFPPRRIRETAPDAANADWIEQDLDLAGAIVIPGFVDGHAHPTGGGGEAGRGGAAGGAVGAVGGRARRARSGAPFASGTARRANGGAGGGGEATAGARRARAGSRRVGGLPRGAKVKYYKGLGTSTSTEAKEYFKKIDQLTVRSQSKTYLTH
jgi:imidazolonepropionase-like amidohydrolase